jgi:acetate kinase
MEEQDYVFPIPFALTKEYDIRRYGAHGTSHRYVSEVAIKEYFADKPESRIIVCHLGSGSSITAVKNGKSIATSMGLTPLGGIMMGTRTGDMDPSVMHYVSKVTKMSVEDVYQLFNKKSGFLGVSGISSDTRDVEEAYKQGNPKAKLAIELFTRRVLDYIGQYYVRLGGVDMIAFTAGIGENATSFREFILEDLKDALGVEYDKIINNEIRGGKRAIISTPASKVLVAVIPTDEEVIIARDCYDLLKDHCNE